MATENDPRYWRGKLMTARRMGRDDDAARAIQRLALLKAINALTVADDAVVEALGSGPLSAEFVRATANLRAGLELIHDDAR